MSKRHQASRRRSYGRRQHEIHEREIRRDERTFDLGVDGPSWTRADDGLAGLEIDFGGRFRFAVGD